MAGIIKGLPAFIASKKQRQSNAAGPPIMMMEGDRDKKSGCARLGQPSLSAKYRSASAAESLLTCVAGNSR